MALKWLRRHQKQLLVPLAIVIIPAFVLVGVTGRGGGSGGGRTAMKIGGETITFDRLWEYHRAYQVIFGARGKRPAEMLQLNSAVSGILQQAKLAEKWGVQVSSAQLQDTIRNIMSRVLGTRDFTDAQYRAALDGRKVSRPVFEEFVTKYIAGSVLAATASGVGHMTDEELFLVYCREKDRIKLRLKDFHVTTYERQVKKSSAPTEEEMKSYFEERKDLSLERDLALKTEPEVAIEYGFVDSESAGRLARTLRRADRAVGFDGGLAGAGGALCGRLAAAALSASYEDRL
ncbi:MAG: SurA N-terminal domain-containing protein, partial [Planctomycetota bacterium]